MSRLIALLAFVALSVVSNACEKVPLLAPSGSTITLTIGETSLPLNGTLPVTAVVIEGSGTAPQNGTVVTFTASLGSFDPIEARTENGLARTTYHAGNRSGTATIRAFSGDAGAGEGSEASVDLLIGGAGVETVLLRTESVSAGGTSTVVVATVLDGDGNPVPGVAVAFNANRGQVTPGVANANGSGEARATVNTSETTEVTATAGGVTSTALTLNAPGSFDLVVTTPPSGTPAEVGQVVTFTLTPATESIFNDVIVDFGDGTPPQSIGRVAAARTFSHTFNARGTYTVTARGTTPTGAVAIASAVVVVNDRAAIAVALTASVNPVSLATSQGLTTLTATPTFPTNVSLSRVDWNFGDGTSNNGSTQLVVPHRFPAAGSYTVTVRVTATDGRQGSAQISITVVP